MDTLVFFAEQSNFRSHVIARPLGRGDLLVQ